jgi:hypothetical protein
MKSFIIKQHDKDWVALKELNDAETALVGGGSGSGSGGCTSEVCDCPPRNPEGLDECPTVTVTPNDGGNDCCDP